MRSTVVALAMGITFVLGAGIAVATTSEAFDTVGTMSMVGMPDMGMKQMTADDMQRMHEALPQAQMDLMHGQMRSAMPTDLRAVCDDMHAAMAAGEAPAMPLHETHHADR